MKDRLFYGSDERSANTPGYAPYNPASPGSSDVLQFDPNFATLSMSRDESMYEPNPDVFSSAFASQQQNSNYTSAQSGLDYGADYPDTSTAQSGLDYGADYPDTSTAQSGLDYGADYPDTSDAQSGLDYGADYPDTSDAQSGLDYGADYPDTSTAQSGLDYGADYPDTSDAQSGLDYGYSSFPTDEGSKPETNYTALSMSADEPKPETKYTALSMAADEHKPEVKYTALSMAADEHKPETKYTALSMAADEPKKAPDTAVLSAAANSSKSESAKTAETILLAKESNYVDNIDNLNKKRQYGKKQLYDINIIRSLDKRKVISAAAACVALLIAIPVFALINRGPSKDKQDLSEPDTEIAEIVSEVSSHKESSTESKTSSAVKSEVKSAASVKQKSSSKAASSKAPSVVSQAPKSTKPQDKPSSTAVSSNVSSQPKNVTVQTFYYGDDDNNQTTQPEQPSAGNEAITHEDQSPALPDQHVPADDNRTASSSQLLEAEPIVPVIPEPQESFIYNKGDHVAVEIRAHNFDNNGALLGALNYDLVYDSNFLSYVSKEQLMNDDDVMAVCNTNEQGKAHLAIIDATGADNDSAVGDGYGGSYIPVYKLEFEVKEYTNEINISGSCSSLTVITPENETKMLLGVAINADDIYTFLYVKNLSSADDGMLIGF